MGKKIFLIFLIICLLGGSIATIVLLTKKVNCYKTTNQQLQTKIEDYKLEIALNNQKITDYKAQIETINNNNTISLAEKQTLIASLNAEITQLTLKNAEIIHYQNLWSDSINELSAYVFGDGESLAQYYSVLKADIEANTDIMCLVWNFETQVVFLPVEDTRDPNGDKTAWDYNYVSCDAMFETKITVLSGPGSIHNFTATFAFKKDEIYSGERWNMKSSELISICNGFTDMSTNLINGSLLGTYVYPIHGSWSQD